MHKNSKKMSKKKDSKLTLKHHSRAEGSASSGKIPVQKAEELNRS